MTDVIKSLNDTIPYKINSEVKYKRMLMGTTLETEIEETCVVTGYENICGDWYILLKSKSGLYGVYKIPLSEIDDCIFV